MATYFHFMLEMEVEFQDGQEPVDKRTAIANALTAFANKYPTLNASTPGVADHSSAKKGRIHRENAAGSGVSYKWRGAKGNGRRVKILERQPGQQDARTRRQVESTLPIG